MKIEFTKTTSANTSKKTNFKKENKVNFKELLNRVSEEEVYLDELNVEDLTGEDITELASFVEKLGEKLSDSPTLENFYSYKKAIKFLVELAKKNFESKETISRISFSKQKLYKTIEVIDENIAKIASMILNQEKNRISYLNLVNNIKGLIIDLML